MTAMPRVDRRAVTILRAQGAIRPYGTNTFLPVGSMDAATLTINREMAEKDGNDAEATYQLARVVTKKTAQIKITGAQETPLFTAISYMDSVVGRTFSQAAGAGRSKTIENAQVGPMYFLGEPGEILRGVTVTSAGGLTANQYGYDEATGYIWFKGGVTGADVTVQFSSVAIDEAAGLLDIAVMSGAGVRGELLLRGVGPSGRRYSMNVWDVEFMPSGDVALSNSGNDFATYPIEGDVFADENQIEIYKFARMVQIAEKQF